MEPSASVFIRAMSEWLPISSVPDERAVEVCVIDETGTHALVVPCRRKPYNWVNWVNAVSNAPLDINPTHWREPETGDGPASK